MRKAVIPATLLVVLLVAFRLLGATRPDWLPNVQPLAALFFCGAAFLAPRWGLALPLAAWLISYPLINALQGWPVFTPALLVPLAGFALVAFVGRRFRGRGTGAVFAGVIASSLAFYGVTSLASWLFDPLYATNASGLIQALWTGPVGYGPSWVFLRNGLAGDLVFAGLFVAAHASVSRRLPAAVPATPAAS